MNNGPQSEPNLNVGEVFTTRLESKSVLHSSPSDSSALHSNPLDSRSCPNLESGAMPSKSIHSKSHTQLLADDITHMESNFSSHQGRGSSELLATPTHAHTQTLLTTTPTHTRVPHSDTATHTRAPIYTLGSSECGESVCGSGRLSSLRECTAQPLSSRRTSAPGIHTGATAHTAHKLTTAYAYFIATNTDKDGFKDIPLEDRILEKSILDDEPVPQEPSFGLGGSVLSRVVASEREHAAVTGETSLSIVPHAQRRTVAETCESEVDRDSRSEQVIDALGGEGNFGTPALQSLKSCASETKELDSNTTNRYGARDRACTDVGTHRDVSEASQVRDTHTRSRGGSEPGLSTLHDGILNVNDGANSGPLDRMHSETSNRPVKDKSAFEWVTIRLPTPPKPWETLPFMGSVDELTPASIDWGSFKGDLFDMSAKKIRSTKSPVVTSAGAM
ncbi:hypothetical protein SARC_00169 [Sphaeroforma arctica JP610]|uniref:Uncharacterized protein n=1 Tax=Sphaeroforma arctica JP610 TaxID=667725 RepID=A0A0L0GFA5_9EUKA|nr:hypothetical protein SARC_00169 [Sphaeroforma arctica JP610]KNC87735.1 hypothetical protein SARC_00169 [Sphaeroforma arctica JP610]|eukprot:XP_014161637.1 hypothetical protein SARC_00169 [Sphaeroforma arctica JP610]